MDKYPKIDTVYKRDEHGRLLVGQYTRPEFEYLADNEWLWTEKVDGTNIRVHWNHEDQKVTFGGRTDNAQIPVFLLEVLQEKFRKEVLRELFPETTLTLYGEGYGNKIQKVGAQYIPDGCDFVLFDVRVGQWWLVWDDILDVAQKLSIQRVPLKEAGGLEEAVKWMRRGVPSWWGPGSFLMEGFVLRPEVDLFCRNGDRVITKIKHKDFLRCVE